MKLIDPLWRFLKVQTSPRKLTPSAIYDTVGWALWTWHHRAEHLTAMRKRAMKARFSWADSAQRYVGLYREALERRTRSEAVER